MNLESLPNPPAAPSRPSSRLRPRHAAAALAALASLALFAACGGPGGTETAAAPQLSPAELAELHESGGITFLDVRSSEEIRELGTLAGHLHIPIDELEDRLAEIPIDHPVVTA